jgi:tetratricopeptide (TPR) repeat protein
LAHIIQQTGKFSEHLLSWLQHNPAIVESPHLAWQVEDLIGHTHHTYGHMEKAIRHTRRVIALKRKAGLPFSSDTVWLGYEYLCLAKRPNPLKPAQLLMTPYNIWRGIRLLKEGVSMAEQSTRPHLDVMAAYYRADLMHSWGNMAMLFGPYCVGLLRPLYLRVERLYRQISQRSDLMQSTYYWLRHLEVKLLAGIPISPDEREEIENKLNELEKSYELVQNNVQTGNTYAYRGLLIYSLDGNVDAAATELNQAEQKWRNAGRGISSGMRRVILFRRFIGQLSFAAASWAFIAKSEYEG